MGSDPRVKDSGKKERNAYLSPQVIIPSHRQCNGANSAHHYTRLLVAFSTNLPYFAVELESMKMHKAIPK